MSYSSSQEIKKENIEEASKIFNQKIISNPNLIESLKLLSKDGEMPKELRPTAWKIYLGVLPSNSDINEWIEKTESQRIKYRKKYKKYFSIKKYKGDPLGGGNSSYNKKKNDRDYNTLYGENELRRIINLDIVRTYQSINLFSQEFIKKLLLNILFIWCKENDDVSYRQGMNELLAVLILCFYPYYFKFENEQKPTKDEIIEYLRIKEESDKDKYIIKIYNFFYDEEEIESDLFFAFDSLMKKGIKNLFNPKILQKNESDYKLYELFPDIFKDDIDEDKPNYISRRCFLLINEKLKIIDEELYLYFKKVDIICGAFLQKWFRCIFCREFELNQVFILWDIILTQDFINQNIDKYSLLFMDCICLAMIIIIRNKLLKSDQNDSFALLFKYPHVHNIRDIIILSYNIYQLINERIKGKPIQSHVILKIAESLSNNDENNDNNNDNDSNINEYQPKNNNFITPFSNSSSYRREFNNSEKDKDYDEYNKKINSMDIKNNYSNNKYEPKSLIDDAILSLGKIGNKLKDQFKVAKDALGFDIYEDDNNINLKKENKMSDLFDIPNFSKEKDKKDNEERINIQDTTNDNNCNKKDFSNIIKRLKRIDDKYNKYFEEEDKKEIEDIIKEILK